MQTNFTTEQLQDPRLAEADEMLRACIHCGLCTATCPTYLLLGDERDGPRGRITLIKDMFEGGNGAVADMVPHMDRCLSCHSCMTTCPSGVDYRHLADLARARIEDSHDRPLKERLLRRYLRNVLPDPRRLRRALWGAVLVRPLRGVLRAIGLKELAAMLDLAPPRGPATGGLIWPQTWSPKAERKKRVVLATGCTQQVLRPQINEATIRLLNRRGVEVVVPTGQACCGAPVQQLGLADEAAAAARRNVDAWSAAMRDEPIDAIVVNAGSCGAVVRDYGHLLRRDEGYRERAEELVARTMDITEFLAELDLDAPVMWTRLRIAYHSACSMQHGSRVTVEPRALLRQAGFSVVEVPEGHICCGAAGAYNILQPDMADALRARKLRNLASVRPDAIATGSIGCIEHLKQASDIPIVHTIELLDWATGGPCPKELLPLRDKVRAVEDLLQEERQRRQEEQMEGAPG